MTDGVRGRSFEESEEKREEYFCPLNILLPPKFPLYGEIWSGNLKEFPIEEIGGSVIEVESHE